MKIRTGFVSNSSSSSFVIAIQQNAGLGIDDKVNEWLDKNKTDILSFIDDSYEEITWDEFVDQAKTFFGYAQHGLNLNNWIVYGQEFASDSGYLFSSYIYCGGHKDTEHIKIADCG